MIPHWVWLTFITIMGANVGSFLNVVIYRLPAGVSLINPLYSRCPTCEKKLAAYDNVPVLGWLWLRGKCRTCKAPISIQYPLIEAATALLFGGSYWLFYMSGFREPMGMLGFGITYTYPIFLVWMVMVAGLLAATMVDAKYYLIPLGIPWFITAIAFVVLPISAQAGMPEGFSLGNVIQFEPFVPIVGPTGALVAWGGLAGLIIAIVLLKLGVVPDSFEGEDDGALDENGELPPLKHPRKVALKELMFVGFPLLGMLVGHYLAKNDVIAHPNTFHNPWYYVLAGCVLGYLVGGGLIWLIRIFGTLGFGKEAMGLGDVHLLGAIGAVMGWHESVFICIFMAPFLALFFTIVLKLLASVNKKLDQPVPYGPYLAAAAVLLLFLGSDRVDLDFVGIYDHFMANPARGIDHLFVP